MLRELEQDEMKCVAGGQIGNDDDDGSKYYYDMPTINPYFQGETGSFGNLFGNNSGGLNVPPGFVVRDRDGNIVLPDQTNENGGSSYDSNDTPGVNEVPGVPDQLEGGTITAPDGYVYDIPEPQLCC